MPKPCPFGTGDCWDCWKTVRETAQKITSGSTIHQLHNIAFKMYGACFSDNEAGWHDAWRRYREVMRIYVASSR